MFLKAARATPAILLLCLISTVSAFAETNEAPALPKDVNALPAELSLRMKDLIRNAEKYRGLKCKHPVPCGSLGKAGLKKKMLQAFDEELPEAKMNPLEVSLKAFDFIPEEMKLAKYYPELLTSQVGGFYDPRRKYLVIVQDGDGVLGKAGKEQYGAELADRMEQTVMVHELTHAIQDQHFDLQRFAIDDPLSDEGAARLALIEGDATLTMYNFFSQMNLEDMPGVEKIMNQLFEDPKQLMAMSPDMPGAKEMENAPAWFRDNLLFSYMNGFTFCINVKKLGGQKLLDYAFTKDPPRSTEQILHPEKWHSKRDDPVVITMPDLSKELPGYKKLHEAQLGEQSIKVLLRDKIKEPASSTAAAGWGGDRFAVYEKEGNRVLVWITEWDSNQDSKEFKEAMASFPIPFPVDETNPAWKVHTPNPSRVVIIRGKLSAAEVDAVNAALAQAKATVPENKALDLAAAGVKARGKEEGNDLAKAMEGVLKDKAGDLDIGALLNNEEFKKLTEGLGGGDLDLGALMKNPQVQEMIKGMLSQERPQGKASDDGRSYTNEKLGFTLKLPDTQKDWKLNPKPPAPMSVIVSDPKSNAQVTIVTQTLPVAMPIDSIGPMLEMGPKMAMQDYKGIKSGMIETSGKKGYELQYEGTGNGERLRSTQRVYIEGSNMLIVTAIAPIEDWAKNEKAINEILAGFSFNKAAAQKKEELKE